MYNSQSKDPQEGCLKSAKKLSDGENSERGVREVIEDPDEAGLLAPHHKSLLLNEILSSYMILRR